MQRLLALLNYTTSTPSDDKKDTLPEIPALNINKVCDFNEKSALNEKECEAALQQVENAINSLDENRNQEYLAQYIEALEKANNIVAGQFTHIKLPKDNIEKEKIFAIFKNYFLSLSNYCAEMISELPRLTLTAEEINQAKADFKQIQAAIDEQNKKLIEMEKQIAETISTENLCQQTLSRLEEEKARVESPQQLSQLSEQTEHATESLARVYDRSSKKISTRKLFHSAIKALKEHNRELNSGAISKELKLIQAKTNKALNKFRNSMQSELIAEQAVRVSHQTFLKNREQIISACIPEFLTKLLAETADAGAWKEKKDVATELTQKIDTLFDASNNMNNDFQQNKFRSVEEFHIITALTSALKKVLLQIEKIISATPALGNLASRTEEIQNVLEQISSKITHDFQQRTKWQQERRQFSHLLKNIEQWFGEAEMIAKMKRG